MMSKMLWSFLQHKEEIDAEDKLQVRLVEDLPDGAAVIHLQDLDQHIVC